MEGTNKPGDLYSNMERFWLNKFSGERKKSHFHYDFKKNGDEHSPAEKKFPFSGELFFQIMKLCKGSNHRLHMILVTGIIALLNKYTGNNDITIAMPVYKHEKEGEFIDNALPLRNEVNPGASFKDLLLQVRQSILRAVENQNYPLELLMHHLKNQAPEKDSSLFDMAVLLENVHGREHIRHLNLDMCFVFNQTGESLEGTLEYNAALYLETSIERIIHHFTRLLEDAIFNIDTRIHDLEMLSGEEIKQLIFDFNNTAMDYPEHKPIHALFVEQAEQTPDHTVLDGHISITYSELNEKSHRLAHHLIRKGVHSGIIVAIMMECPVEMITGLFGILKSGGAYLPIDPGYSTERINYILADSSPKMLVTKKLLEDGAIIDKWDGEIVHTPIWSHLSQEEIPSTLSSPLTLTSTSQVRSASLAYVIYSFDFKREPKSILLSHINVSNYGLWFKKEFEITDKDKFCLAGPFCFDMSATSLIVPLISGALLGTEGYKIERNPHIYTGHLAKSKRSILKLTPSWFRLLLDFMRKEDLKTLRYIILGGEAVDGNDVRKYLACYPRQRIVNEYGHPETTVAALFYSASGDNFKQENETVSNGTNIEGASKKKIQDWNNPPIGKPISNVQVYILDKYFKILPMGVAGELFAGGAGTAMGYLNNPELTSEKFVFYRYYMTDIPKKVYRTGDLARWLDNGKIEFLGRIDRQVNIEGFRVEPREIECCLKAYEYVLNAFVLAREGSCGDIYLCAYFVGVSGNEKESSPSKLRKFLEKELPSYMTPSYFVRLEEIPLTSRGIVDVSILPEPGEGSAGLTDIYIPPGNEKERLLSEIWGEIFGIERVGVYDNFFDLGGNSIYAISVISQVHKEFGIRIPISMVFNRPTISEMGKVLGKGRGESLPDVQKCPGNDYYPLSHSQMRLWFFTQMEPDNPAYNVPSVIRISGNFDTGVFKESWAILVDRHEALRTAITVVEKESPKGMEEIPVQIILDTVEIDIKEMNMSYLPWEEREEKLQRVVEEEGKRPFDLEQAPLFRVMLIKLEDREYVLGVIVHHIISDNWSTRQITKEFTYLYHRLKKNLPAKLPPLEFHYKDFAYWQSQVLSEKRLDGQREYWHEKLSGQLPVLDLRTDYNRPAIQSSRGGQVTIEIDPQLAQRLKQLSRGKLSTLFMILTATFKALLYRYTNQEDIIVGTLIAGRSGSGLEKIIGYFVNILALRDEVTGQMTFEDFLGQVKRTMLEAYDNQDYPFDKLVDELKVERDLGRSPVFDVLLAYQNVDELLDSFSSLQSLKISPFEKTYVVSKYDLYLDIFNFSDYIKIIVEFCTDLFKKETIRRMFEHYLNLVQSAIDTPGRIISHLDIISEEEKRQLLEDFNNTRKEIPLDRCYHELFQEQARRTPGRIAVTHRGTSATYSGLNQWANRMAHCLVENGIKPGVMVPLYMKRSIHMLASILAIFKAGGGYIPIEVEHPKERTRFLIQDSGITVIIADTELKQRLEEIQQDMDTPLQVLWWVDSSPAGGGAQSQEYPIENPGARSTPDDYAYMIYTSGTTGRPKGVLIHQQGMINHLYAKINDLSINQNDRVAQTASQCFDISVWQFLAALLKGGAVGIFGFEIVLDPEAMLKGLQEEKITIFESVPSLMSVFLDMVENRQEADLNHLRWMIPTGEALKPMLVLRWFQYYPDIKLVNAYGPTEASDDITHYIIDRPSDVGERSVPIGKPVQNMRIYILNKDLSLCPIGVRGEICVAGIGVGKGYWGAPGKTTRAFINNPYAPGGMNREYAVLYKTGDIGYFRDDGNIECLGRIDNQVKLRGFRIEMEEIEALMNRYPALNECAVIVKKKENGVDLIIGFFVEREPVDLEELKRFLLDYLPGYMIPSAFVKLKKLPLAISGKVDRQALAAMDIDALSSTPDAAVEFVGPYSHIEKIIAGIWADILEKDDISVNDNFFDIGGHSLLIPRILRKLEKQFPGKCKIADLFEHMTINRLSRHIYGTIETGEEEEIIELSID